MYLFVYVLVVLYVLFANIDFCMRQVESFGKIYELRDEVMPSTHPGITVRFARVNEYQKKWKL